MCPCLARQRRSVFTVLIRRSFNLRHTTCTSSSGIIEGSSLLGSNTTFYIQFRRHFYSLSHPASSTSLQLSHTYPILPLTAYTKLDTEGCIGCLAESIWPATDLGSQARGFCEDYLQGYVYRSCVMGDTGNGVWETGVSSECREVISSPSLGTGEAYYRDVIEVRREGNC